MNAPVGPPMETLRAAQARNENPGDDGRENAGLRRDARGDGKGHGQRQGDDSHGDARHEVGVKIRPGIGFERIQQFGPKPNGEVHGRANGFVPFALSISMESSKCF